MTPGYAGTDSGWLMMIVPTIYAVGEGYSNPGGAHLWPTPARLIVEGLPKRDSAFNAEADSSYGEDPV